MKKEEKKKNLKDVILQKFGDQYRITLSPLIIRRIVKEFKDGYAYTIPSVDIFFQEDDHDGMDGDV